MFAISTSLSQIVDDHIAWFMAWHRMAFFKAARTSQTDSAHPQRLALWLQDTEQTSLKDQPAFEKIGLLHDEMHGLARRILERTPVGDVVSSEDYEALTLKYQAFLSSLREQEKIFSSAYSGLDSLTGLRSRQNMIEDLSRETGRYMRSGKSFCIAMMDLDYFKKVNDTYGHDIGDKVLTAVAEHVTRSVRIFDDAYRYGGEEFLMCLKDTTEELGIRVLDRLCKSLAALPITLPSGEVLHVTASFGLAAAEQHVSVENLIQRADKALLQAKDAGRNQIAVGR